jgi:hypothetical protein
LDFDGLSLRVSFFEGFFVLWMFVPLITSFFLFFSLCFYECFFFFFLFLIVYPLIMIFFSILKCLSLLLWGFILIFMCIYLWDLFIFWGMDVFWGLFVHIWKELVICESSLWKLIWSYGSHGRVACNITNLTKRIILIHINSTSFQFSLEVTMLF